MYLQTSGDATSKQGLNGQKCRLYEHKLPRKHDDRATCSLGRCYYWNTQSLARQGTVKGGAPQLAMMNEGLIMVIITIVRFVYKPTCTLGWHHFVEIDQQKCTCHQQR